MCTRFTLQQFPMIHTISIKSYQKCGKQIIQQTQHTVLCSSIFVQVPIATTVAVIVAFVDAQQCPKCLTLNTSFYKSQNIRHRIFHARKPFIIPKIFYFKSENSTLFSDIPGNILYQTKHYYSRIYGGIYGAGQFQDPRHPHLTSDTNYSFSSSNQKEKEEKYSANVNLSFMSFVSEYEK